MNQVFQHVINYLTLTHVIFYLIDAVNDFLYKNNFCATDLNFITIDTETIFVHFVLHYFHLKEKNNNQNRRETGTHIFKIIFNYTTFQSVKHKIRII